MKRTNETHAVAWGGAIKIAGATACVDFREIAQNNVLLKKPHPFERG